MEIVTDKSSYEAERKNFLPLHYMLGRDDEKGYYEGRVPHKTLFHLLIKVINL